MPGELAWLEQTVPLWAFLVALLTSPAEWAKRVRDRLGPAIDMALPGAGTNDQ